MSDYTPPVGGNNNYMSQLNNSWGHHTPQQKTADKIDNIADKAKFALDMQDMIVQAIDMIEKEIMEMAGAPQPPNSSQLRTLAHRLNGQQQQLRQVMSHTKTFMKDIDHATDNIQRAKYSW